MKAQLKALRTVIITWTAVLAAAQCCAQLNEQILKSFDGLPQSGWNPLAPLIRGSDGALYGTTFGNPDSGVFGTVFTINPDGTGYTNLHNFSEVPGDAQNPSSALVQGANGVLYGRSQYGQSGSPGGLFKVKTEGTGYSVLYNLNISGSDGITPWAGLVQGTNGALFGTTYSGGASNAGTVFAVNSDGTGYNVLHSFGSSPTDGQNPYSTMIQGSNGVLFGVTYNGGMSNVGTIFGLNPDGTAYSTVYNFGNNASDGTHPVGGLLRGLDLYGTTASGGAGNAGTVFKINTDGTGYATLYSFGGFTSDGAGPQDALARGNDGALYGTTYTGGASNAGAVFKIDPDGTGYAIVYSFGVSAHDGANPQGGLIQDQQGTWYGTTVNGGSSGGGTVFRLTSLPIIVVQPKNQTVLAGTRSHLINT